MKSLYFECANGISGDMIVASLLDLGADEAVLRKVLSGIKDDGLSIEISRVMKSSIDVCDFNVILSEEYDNHDHDMNYLYGHDKSFGSFGDGNHEHHHGDEGHEHHHGDESHEHHHGDEGHEHHHGDESHEHHHGDEGHEHHHGDGSHEHHHGDEGHEHHHAHRNLADILEIINSLDMTDNARRIAVKTFTILAEAEAKAHNKDISEVHFHEVGALDSIVDIVSAAVCLDNLNVDDVIFTKLCEGQGTVRCQHGILPIPVPAVINIAVSHHLPISITNRRGEMVTPTGAAFAAAVMTKSSLPPVFIPVGVGLGAGKREYEYPSVLRAILFENVED